MPAHSSHLLQPLDVSCFSVLKRSYGRLVSKKMALGVNHINKPEFITLYQQARIEALHERNILSSFTATGLIPYDPERVLSVLGVPVQTPSPQLVPQEDYTPATPHDIKALEQQTKLIKQYIKRRTHSPPSPSMQAFDQLVKGCQLAMHGAVVLAQQNIQLLAENRRQKAKRAKKRTYIAKRGILTGAEARELIVGEDNGHGEAETGNSDEIRQRAPSRCSLCSSLEHRAPKCPERQQMA
jgi:hypothetical protein